MTENRDQLINQLVVELRSQSRIYHRISRVELKESLTAVFDAYSEFLISQNQTRLKISLKYWVIARMGQLLELKLLMKIVFALFSVLRKFSQKSYRDMPEQDAVSFNKTMAGLENACQEMANLLIESFEEYQQHPKMERKSSLTRMDIFRA